MKTAREQGTFFLYILETTRALACVLAWKLMAHVPICKTWREGEESSCYTRFVTPGRTGINRAWGALQLEGYEVKILKALKTTNQALSLLWSKSITVKIRTFPIWEEDLDFCECFKIWVLITGCRREISQRNNHREQIFRKWRGDTIKIAFYRFLLLRQAVNQKSVAMMTISNASLLPVCFYGTCELLFPSYSRDCLLLLKSVLQPELSLKSMPGFFSKRFCGGPQGCGRTHQSLTAPCNPLKQRTVGIQFTTI